jgi:hypothetical protein
MNASTDAKPRIGFIGLGLMGHGMAKNLVAKGFPLTVRVHRNRKPLEDIVAAGAREVATNADVARASDIVFLCVTGSPQVEAVVRGADGLLEAAREGLIVVDTSTAEPASTAALRTDFAAKRAEFVDAPLARTPKEAEEGRLNIMVGADDAVFEKLKPVLAAFCENVIHAGPPGHGHTLKLINNFMAMSIATSTAEAVAAVDDRFDLGRPGDAEEHDVRLACDLGIGSDFPGPRGDDVSERLAVPVHAHRERKSLGEEVPGNAVTHQAEPDEADARLRVRGCVHVPSAGKEGGRPELVRPLDRFYRVPPAPSRRRWVAAPGPAQCGSTGCRCDGRGTRAAPSSAPRRTARGVLPLAIVGSTLIRPGLGRRRNATAARAILRARPFIQETVA